MLKPLKTYLEFGNSFCGVEHTTQKDQDIIYATVLKMSKKIIDIESSFKETSFETVISKLHKKQHVFLIINNDHVLTKRLESEQTDTLKLAYNAFPNINLEDFFYEVMTQGNIHFVSICRKAYVEELIAKYKEYGISVINVSLGNTIAFTVYRFVNHQSLFSSNTCISIENDAITSVEKTEIETISTYDINGLQANNNQLLSLSAALDSALQNFNPATNFDVLKLALKNNHSQSRFYTMFLRFGLVFILGILLINFFVFNHYFEEVNRLQQTPQINQTTKQNMLELNERVAKSQKMVEDMLQSSSSKSTYYINTIIQGLPNSILLSELDYQPLLKRIKNGQAIETNNNTVLISGASNDSELFSNWLTFLESINWIQHVEILGYEDISKSNSNFSLKLTITHD